MSTRPRSAAKEAAAGVVSNGVRSWEDWYAGASAEQREAILQVARSQGLVYFHQLPQIQNGLAKAPAADDGRLTQALSGNVSALPAVAAAEVDEDADLQLDAAQREAVARALATPDVCLVEGLPGCGKTSVAAAILRQACRRGLRVLFVAHRASSIDAALLRLVGCKEAQPLRNLGPAEAAAHLHPAIAAWTPAQRAQAFPEEMHRLAQTLLGQADAVSDSATEQATWTRLAQLSDEWEGVQEKDARLQAEEAAIVEPMAGEAGAASTTETRSAAVESLAQAQARFDEARARTAAARAIADTRRGGRWWTWAWWRSFFAGGSAARLAECEDRERQAHAGLNQAQQALARLDEKAVEEKERERLRRESHAAERRQLAESRERLTSAWREAASAIGHDERPKEIGRAALEEARRLAGARAERQTRKATIVRDWARHLQTQAPDLARRFADWTNIVAGPLDALPRNDEARFDLLLLEDAHLITEADLLRLSRRAARWVLIADHQPDTLYVGRKDSSVRVGEAPQSLRSRCFHKLWQHLHGDLTRLPYAWSRENGKLCCHLRTLSADERGKLESERLADFPEVELRILPVPQPALAQIIFPAEMTLAQAKQFVFRELQEVPIQRLGRTAWVREEPQRILCSLVPYRDANGAQPVDLAMGLREWADEGHSTWVEFDKTAGWTRPQAELWLQQHMRLRDAGRTMFLGASYRAQPALAQVLADLLYPDLLIPGCETPSAAHGAVFTLVPVPAPQRDNGRKILGPAQKLGADTIAWPKEGAGFEVDLTAVRSADRIPNDLRASLPRRGFANYFEAQALIQHLEGRVKAGTLDVERVAVAALYDGQVELIRKLASRSESLRHRKVTVGLPETFRQCEFDSVLISVTRSHSHRAVALGEHPADLALALTRARRQVVLFADPGNLVKRAAWHGPLEHLDAAAAALEAQRVSQLVRYLHGQGKHQAAFRVEA